MSQEFWTREQVWSRYLEAFATLIALPNQGGGSSTAWPSVIREFADAIGAEETRAVEGYPFPKGWSRPAPPSHQAIDQMEQVWGWHVKYLSIRPDEARMLIVMAWCRARGRSLSRLLRAMRVPRRHAYRVRDAALETVRKGLSADRIENQNVAAALVA